MRKCYQTMNVYGLKLTQPCNGWGHSPESGSPTEACDMKPANCHHHTPVYNEFANWVKKTREEQDVRQVLPKV